jgi:hypothetical protein
MLMLRSRIFGEDTGCTQKQKTKMNIIYLFIIPDALSLYIWMKVFKKSTHLSFFPEWLNIVTNHHPVILTQFLLHWCHRIQL